jgi:hypothetical protein
MNKMAGNVKIDPTTGGSSGYLAESNSNKMFIRRRL